MEFNKNYRVRELSKEGHSKLLDVIEEVHNTHADDQCWMDIDKIFVAAGLPVPDRSVGDKTAMIVNCGRFIETMCRKGEWKSYAELEAELNDLKDWVKSIGPSRFG